MALEVLSNRSTRGTDMFNKKNEHPAKKLILTKETLRRLNESLTETQLQQVAGGRSGTCSVDNCPFSETTAPC